MTMEVGVPSEGLIHEWVTEAGGEIDGQSIRITTKQMQKVMKQLASIVGRVAVAAMRIASEESQESEETEDQTEVPRSPHDPNPAVLEDLVPMAERLLAMRNSFRTSKTEGWEPLLVEIEGAVRRVQAALILACGKPE